MFERPRQFEVPREGGVDRWAGGHDRCRVPNVSQWRGSPARVQPSASTIA